MPADARTLTTISVADDPSTNRYELRVDGQLAATANYILGSDKIVISYSELLRGFEGRGLGQQLAGAVLDDVRARDLAVVARCPFFATFIEDHPEYLDLIDAPLAIPVPLLRVARA